MPKKFFQIMFFLLLISIFTACSSSSESVKNVSEASQASSEESSSENSTDKTYTVAMDHSFAPFGFLDDDTGEHIGFDVDLLAAIEEVTGLTFEKQIMEFDGVVAGLSSGKFDMGVAAIAVTDERKENIEFSIPYYYSGLVVAVKDGNDEIKSIDDVDGKVVATRTGTTSHDYLAEKTDAIPELFPQITEAYQAVLTGRADAAIHDLPSVQYYSNKEAGGQLKIVGDLLESDNGWAIGFPKGSDLVDTINDALEELMENGTYDDIYEKWFGERPKGT